MERQCGSEIGRRRWSKIDPVAEGDKVRGKRMREEPKERMRVAMIEEERGRRLIVSKEGEGRRTKV